MMTATAGTECRDETSVLLDSIVSPDETAEIDTNWPMIQLILNDDLYRAAYVDEVRAALATLEAPAVAERIVADHELIAPYVALEESPYQSSTVATFEASLTSSRGTGLLDLLESRQEAVESELSSAGW